ncbi:hypothetical protein [Hyperthermus butylicus]|uniref:Conserved crenarchaeal protein n=1 Tax=Hyperthermus butylicus (strain DSM 5456 / JCM 9403 / PLM1-5) TaxID=415426 RepID=A2BM96_HYPBU|nr:hypothetical protein [Hyperthermus butylicus]ABM81107.1 conserved crenarchaeal protein [Hyperthermus butylicus DSM 5456]
MPKPVKLVLVTAEHHPQHKLWLDLLERLVEKTRLKKEIKIEDYVYLIEHGDTDEYGMAWLPQLLVELNDGSVKLLISRLPLNKSLQPDIDEAERQVLRKLAELGLNVES